MKLCFLSVIAFLGVGLKLVEGVCVYKSACPQSTFASTQTGDNWACPSFWIKSKFSSIRTVSGIRDLDTSNLTAEVRHDGNKTSVSLCAATLPKPGDANIKTWPSGPYCVPSPLTAACPDSMTRLSATVSAAGRDFSCDDTQAITNCTAGSFNLNACCPSNMTAGGAYLNLPVYNVGTFFLLKTSDSCPDIYSYSSREESITIPNATISAGFPQFLANNSASGDVTITFCRYKGVSCAGRALVKPYELFVMEGQCKREVQVFCNYTFGYIEQPANKTNYYSDFCLPTGNYGNKPAKLCGKQCPALPPVANGNYAGYSTAPPAVVRVECDDGHYVAGANSTSCQRNGTWSTDLSGTKCVFAQCDGNSLPDKTTGLTKWRTDGTSNPYAFGHKVTFYCDTSTDKCAHFDDFTTEYNVTCLQSGKWSTAKQCRAGSQCSAPIPTNSSVYSPSASSYSCGESIKYTCLPGRITLDKNITFSLTCLNNGSWSAPPPTCEAAMCVTPPLSLSNGEVEKPVNTSTIPGMNFQGDTLGFTCDPMYRLIKGVPLITCTKDGTWSGPTSPECVLIVCPMAPLAIPHGKRVDGLVNQTEYHLGDEVVYTCDDEYELNYTDHVACNNSAQWNPYIPSCEVVSCGRPPIVNHTIPAGPDPKFPIHTNYTYECEAGYSAVNSTVQCEYDAEGTLGWQGTTPTCVPVYCGAVPNITHGSYDNAPNASLTRYPYNTQYKYTCIPGYNATVTSSTNCSAGGSWQPAPGCHAILCHQPGVLYSIVNDTRPLLPYHAHLRIRCDDSRLYKTPQELICGDNGIWESRDGGKILTCMQPKHLLHANKWTFGGVGIAMLIILIGLILVYVVRKKRRESESDRTKFAFSADNNELTGFDNPTYEDGIPSQIAIDRSGSKLVLRGGVERVSSITTQDSERTESGESRYDTLHGAKYRGGGVVEEVSAPAPGHYNTLSNIRTHEVRNEYADPPGVVPNTDEEVRGGVYTDNAWGTTPWSPSDQEEEEEVYNVPTMGRRPAQDGVQINDLYNNAEAAEICGSPMETDFDNIVYDNI